MEDRFTFGLNPEKLGAVSSYLCDLNTAPAEFLLVKSQYLSLIHILGNFKRLGVPSEPMDGRARLALLHSQMHPGLSLIHI